MEEWEVLVLEGERASCGLNLVSKAVQENREVRKERQENGQRQ